MSKRPPKKSDLNKAWMRAGKANFIITVCIMLTAADLYGCGMAHSSSACYAVQGCYPQGIMSGLSGEDGIQAGVLRLLKSSEGVVLAAGTADKARSSGNDSPPVPELQTVHTEDQKDDKAVPQKQEQIILGDEQYDEYLPLLEGKRVALFSNQTGIVGNQVQASELTQKTGSDLVPFGLDAAGEEVVYGEHILDALLEQNLDVSLVFTPEHGFRGQADAGGAVSSSVDEKTGVPLISLYGSSKYPSADAMSRFDVLVIDIQDVGLRYYTYYLTMMDLLDACAAYDELPRRVPSKPRGDMGRVLQALLSCGPKPVIRKAGTFPSAGFLPLV